MLQYIYKFEGYSSSRNADITAYLIYVRNFINCEISCILLVRKGVLADFIFACKGTGSLQSLHEGIKKD